MTTKKMKLMLFVIAISVLTTAVGSDKPFPTALGPGHVTTDGQFVKQTIIPHENLPQQIISADNARFKVDLGKLLNQHDMVWDTELAGYWYDGAPLGNGDIGAIIYGYPENLHIVLSKSDVWDRRNDVFDVNHLPGEDYNQLRQTYYDNDWDGYLNLVKKAATARRQKTLALPHMTTCGRLSLHLDGGIRIFNPKMKVNLKDGLMTLTYNDRKIRALVSRQYDVIMFDIDRGAPRIDPPDPILWNRYGATDPFEELPWEFWRPALEGNDKAECSSDGQFYFATQRFRVGGYYTVGITFTSFNKQDSAILPARIAGYLSDIKQQRCQMYVTIVSSEDVENTEDAIKECKRRLSRAVKAGPDTILAEHRKWWHNYWMRGLASVADKAVEKWYYISLYHCGSMFEPGRQSPGLQGVWCGFNFPQWCADFHSNVNIQSNYWGLMTNNRLDLMEPYINYYQRIADISRRTAREYYRMKGLRFPHASSIGGTELCRMDISMLGIDPCGSAWVGQLLWQYYQYTLDKKYLRDIAYPMLRDVALFYSDVVVRDKKTGKWTIDPVVHYEAGHKPFMEPFYMWGKNSLYANSMFRVGFSQAIQAAQVLGVDEQYQKLWSERLDNMSPMPVSKTGYWKKWENHSDNYYPRKKLTPMFPSELVSKFHGDKSLYDQALKTFKHYRTGKTAPVVPWCGGTSVCGLIRLGTTESVNLAFRSSRWSEEKQYLKNGFKLLRSNALFQADHAPGMCRVLADMLVLGLDGTIYLFAGIPQDQPARCLSLRAPGGFLITAEKRSTEPDYVIIKPTADRKLKLSNPWKTTATVTDLQNNKVIYTTEKPIIEIKLELNREYLIAKKGFDITDLSVADFASY